MFIPFFKFAKKMKKSIYLIILFFSMISTFSQRGNLETQSSLQSLTSTNLNGGGVWLPGKVEDKTITGSVYLFPSWNGIFKIITKNGDIKQLLNLNYNIKNKNIEAFISNDSVFQFDKNQFDYIVQSNKKYKVFNDENLNGLFLEVFNGNKIKLYKEFSISVLDGIFNPLTQEKIELDKYVQNYSYYIFKDNKYEKIKLTKKDILKYLSDKKDLIKEYVNKNSLNFTTDEDVSIILKHYNTL